MTQKAIAMDSKAPPYTSQAGKSGPSSPSGAEIAPTNDARSQPDPPVVAGKSAASPPPQSPKGGGGGLAPGPSSDLAPSIQSPMSSTGAAAAERVQALWANVSTSARTILTHVENTLHDTFHDLLNSTTVRPLPSDLSAEDIGWVLGKREILDEPGLLRMTEDFSRRPRMTYRYEFEPIGTTAFTSDSGWGCMVRVGQSLLLEGLIRIKLGRDFVPDAGNDEYMKLVRLFKDEPEAPLSIHAISAKGLELDTEVGQWFGPTIIAQAFKKISNDHAQLPSVVVAQDAMVFATDVKLGLEKGPITLLIPLRLGIDALHPSYWSFIKECFKSPLFIGIAGGRPSSALYMVGTFRDGLLVLDPHITQPALQGTPEDTPSSIHTDQVRCILSVAMDPSLCLGFVLRSVEEWNKWTEWVYSTKEQMDVPLTIQATAPTVWDDDVNCSESEQEAD